MLPIKPTDKEIEKGKLYSKKKKINARKAWLNNLRKFVIIVLELVVGSNEQDIFEINSMESSQLPHQIKVKWFCIS